MNFSTQSVSGLMHQRPFVLFWLALTIGGQIHELTNSRLIKYVRRVRVRRMTAKPARDPEKWKPVFG
jgi:hypothetical protein